MQDYNNNIIFLQVLFSKLFAILGILWIFSCLHYLLHGNHRGMPCGQTSTKIEIFFRVTDSFNLLRGFFMFVIFVCKKNVLRKARVALGVKTAPVLSTGNTIEMAEISE